MVDSNFGDMHPVTRAQILESGEESLRLYDLEVAEKAAKATAEAAETAATEMAPAVPAEMAAMPAEIAPEGGAAVVAAEASTTPKKRTFKFRPVPVPLRNSSSSSSSCQPLIASSPPWLVAASSPLDQDLEVEYLYTISCEN